MRDAAHIRSGTAGRLLLATHLALAAATHAAARGPEVPLPELSNAQPQVRAKIIAARDRVVADPGSAAAWGHLGMILHAHRCIATAGHAYEQARALVPRDFRWSYFHGVLLLPVDPRNAVGLLENAIALDPAYAPARVRLGLVYEALGRLDDAWSEYGQAVRLDPTNGTARRHYGTLALQRGETDLAIEELEAALALHADDPAIMSALARAYYRSGDIDRARVMAKAVRQTSPRSRFDDPRSTTVMREAVNLRAYFKRAKALQEVGRLDEALADLQQGLAHAPDDTPLHVALADVYLRMGEYEKAIVASRKALSSGLQVQEIHKSLAIALFRLGRLEDADLEARQGLEETPHDADLHQIRGLVLAQQGRADEAIEHLEQSLDGKPDDLAARFLLARLLLDRSRFDEATKHFERVVHALPRDVEAWSLLGAALMRSEHYDRALTTYESAWKIAPGNESLARGAGAALVALRRYREAAERLRAALSVHPRAWNVANDLAWLLATCPDSSVRDGDAAIALAEPLVNDPATRSPPTLDTLAAAYAEAGRFEDAVGIMDQAIRLAEQAAQPAPRIEGYRNRQAMYRAGRPYRSP